MKMKKKSLVSFVFVCISMLAFGRLSVSADTGTQYGDTPLYYELSNGEVTITDCDENATGEVAIPKTIEDYPVTSIGRSAFSYSDLTSITIPDSVTSIGDAAFSDCQNLTNINIPNGITDIGYALFWNCTGLTSITIPNSVTSIGDGAFFNCRSLTNITLPDDITSIGDRTFCNCSRLINIILPNGITSIGDSAFNGSGLTSITIPDGVTSIGDSAFASCGRLTSVTIPDSVTSIGNSAFEYCSRLTNVIIPDNITSIGNSTFYYCSSLTEITLPQSITEIKWRAFDYCPKLSNVYYNGDEQDWGKINIDIMNDYLQKAERKYFWYVTLVDEKGIKINKKKYDINTFIDISDIPKKYEHTIHLYIDEACENEFYQTTPITKNVLLQFRYIANKYKSKFIDDDGTVIHEGLVDYGTVIIPPNPPTKGSTPKYTYTFVGWNGFYDGIRQTNNEMIFTARYNETVNQYKAKFIDDDGTLICEKLVNYGTVIIPPEIPTTKKTPKYTYTFIGWDGFYDGITQTNNEMVFVAKYDAVINQYTYKFINENGTVICEELVDYGTTIVPPASPTKENTPKYTYVFIGWDGFYDGITQTNNEMVFVAKYRVIINQYNAKFIDDDGTLISEGLVDYGAVIVPPADPTKARTQKYTYTFAGWENFTPGETTQTNSEMVFKATYTMAINQYTYKFIDSDGTVIKEETVDYGTVITLPETPADKDPYTFDYWENYFDGMALTDNIEFKAAYKYKTYTITVKGLENPIDVVYDDAFEIETQTPETEYLFGGYYTEENGKGIKATDENGKSLENFGFLGNITLYPYFPHELLNKIKINGESSTVVGNTDVVKKVYFATDKEASYLLCNIKYPESISLKEIVPIDFKYVSEESRKTIDGTVYLNLICQYTNDLDNLPINKKIEPFELVFDIPKDTKPQNATIEVTSESMVIGENDYPFDYIINGELEIAAKPVETIVIIGDDSIVLENGDIVYTAEITPDYATNKEVTWLVDNEEIAKISQNGILTPLKNGKVTITASAKDGSGVFATKDINILPFAKINSLITNIGQWDKEFNADTREYTIYVPFGTNELSFTADYVGGTLKVNNGTTTATMMKNRAKVVKLGENDTNVILLRGNQTGCADSEYKITIVKFEGTKTTVSEDGKTFDVKPFNVAVGSAVVLALYDNGNFVEMKSEKYNGTDIQFTTDNAYTNAKVMVWESLENMKPVCETEVVK